MKHAVQNVTIVFMAGENVLSWNYTSTRINIVVLRYLVWSLGCLISFHPSFKAKLISFIVQGDRLSFSIKTYLARGKTQRTAFFWRLLHQPVPLRIRCASPPLTTSLKIASSTGHREQAIIAVRSCLPIKYSCERKTIDMHARVLYRMIMKWSV